jgi:hypothetical protein
MTHSTIMGKERSSVCIVYNAWFYKCTYILMCTDFGSKRWLVTYGGPVLSSETGWQQDSVQRPTWRGTRQGDWLVS